MVPHPSPVLTDKAAGNRVKLDLVIRPSPGAPLPFRPPLL